MAYDTLLCRSVGKFSHFPGNFRLGFTCSGNKEGGGLSRNSCFTENQMCVCVVSPCGILQPSSPFLFLSLPRTELLCIIGCLLLLHCAHVSCFPRAGLTIVTVQCWFCSTLPPPLPGAQLSYLWNRLLDWNSVTKYAAFPSIRDKPHWCIKALIFLSLSPQKPSKTSSIQTSKQLHQSIIVGPRAKWSPGTFGNNNNHLLPP